ncbi:MAG: hypothetical protein HFJ34_03785 [Clostridia bacterium]|nr:hypothetical protein [Clostridia bacterium]
MKSKVRVWVDQKDIKISCTNDKIINITGMIGSGKTTTANQYRTDSNYIVISLDCLYRGQDKENMNQDTEEINQLLKQKFPNQDNEQYFKQYYDEILKYINRENKPITWVIEGQHIYRYLNFEDLKGTLIVKRTCLMNCWKRSITRHVKKKKTQLKNGEITKKQYHNNIWYWIKRRTKQLKYYKKLNQFLDEILNVN